MLEFIELWSRPFAGGCDFPAHGFEARKMKLGIMGNALLVPYPHRQYAVVRQRFKKPDRVSRKCCVYRPVQLIPALLHTALLHPAAIDRMVSDSLLADDKVLHFKTGARRKASEIRDLELRFSLAPPAMHGE